MAAAGKEKQLRDRGNMFDISTPAHSAATVGRLLYPQRSAHVEGQRDTFREACASEEVMATLGVQVGSWVLISQSAPGAEAAKPSFLVRLVEAGDGAAICPLPVGKKGGSPPALYLPANLLEHLGATPGRSIVVVSRRDSSEEPPLAGRLTLAQVRAPQSGSRFRAALRSFFLVPRMLRKGEVFSVPVRGLPQVLREIEDLGATSEQLEPADASEEEDDTNGDKEDTVDSWHPGISPSEGDASARVDPLSGLAFCEMLSFRVEEVAPAAKQVGRSSISECCFKVDSEKTEVVVKGTCQARGLPYIASHHFGAAPAPLPPPLQEPFQRLLSTMAPAVRAWLRQSTSGGVPPVHPHAALVTGPRGCGKRILWRALCDRLGLHIVEANCYRLVAQSPGAVEDTLQTLLLHAAECSPSVVCLRRLQALTQAGPAQSPAAGLLLQRRLESALAGLLSRIHEGAEAPAERRSLVFLAGTCEDVEDVGGPLRQVFQIEVALKRPDEEARAAVLAQLLPVYRREQGSAEEAALDLSAASLAKLTVGLSYTDLRSVCSEVAMRSGDPGADQAELAERAVKRLQGGSKVAVTLASKVQWADVGGLEGAKEEIINCISLPLAMGAMFEGQKLRSGILLFGPPGTGKTLLAKAVATECKVHFLSVKGPELLSMYIGESEKNVRSLFQSARELKPCVVFFDELDSLAPARGRGSDSGGVMDRIVSQLVTELDALPATVFLVGATNRPDLLDRSLLRPGRLDRTVYLGIAKDKLPLLRAVTRKFHLDQPPGAPEGGLLQMVANACPPNLTGADVSSLCTDAYALAQKDHIGRLHTVAAEVGASVSTLLLFLEGLEASPGAQAARARSPLFLEGLTSQSPGAQTPRPTSPVASGTGAVGSRCPLVPVFPLPANTGVECSCVLSGAATGLALYRGRQYGGTGPFVLVMGAGGAGDAGAAVILEPVAERTPAAGEGSIFPSPRRPPLALEPAWDCNRCRQRLMKCGTLTFDPISALKVPVGLQHFQEAVEKLQPSVSMADLQRYEQLREEYQNVGQ